jgi:hypothetical protein
MDTNALEQLKEKAKELTKRYLEEPLEEGGAVGATADGHQMDPPVYPAYKSDTFTFKYDDSMGIWVYCQQKDVEESPWDNPGHMVPYSDLR